MENTVIKIQGMSCQGCVKNITGVLTALAGVASAEVSLEAAEARVAFDVDSRRAVARSRMPASTPKKNATGTAIVPNRKSD
jgi:copper chaperone CopZ